MNWKLAISFIPAKTIFPDRKVIAGNPCKIIKDVSDKMIGWKTEGTKIYQALPEQCHQSLKPCEPLREVPANQTDQAATYKTWKNTTSS